MPDAMTNPGALTRMDRARIVRDSVLAEDHRHGRWEDLTLSADWTARVRIIDTGKGWSAMVTTTSSRSSKQVPVDDHVGLKCGARIRMPNEAITMDVYLDGARKVLSIRYGNKDDALIGMIPGPWESKMFGLPHKEWSAAEGRRLARNESATMG